MIAVSGLTGAGLDDLRAALDRLSARAGDRARVDGPARLHVDRSFTLKGIGTVVTGTLWSGELQAGQEVRLRAGGAERACPERPGARPRRATGRVAGQRVALNLAGVGREEVQRGDVVTDDASAHADLPGRCAWCGWTVAPSALRRGTRVQFHHGTRETPARVAPLEGETLEPGCRRLRSCGWSGRSCRPRGDRFVIRRVAPPDTIGGGGWSTPRPRRHGPGVEHAKRLTALASADPLERLAAVLDEARSGLRAGRW